MRLRHLLIFGWIFTGIISLLLFLFIVTSDDEESSGAQFDYSGLNLSAEVLKHQPTVEKYARKYGIEDYVNYLLAIMQVESGGTGEDVMQSSESLGLPPNSLNTEQSIEQGCKYFASLLSSAEAKGCDINTVVQSYNYGGGFIDYVAARGKKYSFALQRASQGRNPAASRWTTRMKFPSSRTAAGGINTGICSMCSSSHNIWLYLISATQPHRRYSMKP